MPLNTNATLTDNSTAYVNSTKYDDLASKLTKLKSILDDNEGRNRTSRKMRYVEVDIEVERSFGRLAPDELYIPQHIIDTNIRREQSSYVQFVVQSPRAIILKDNATPSNDCTVLEQDVTAKLRYSGYQIPMFGNIDGFQQNGWGVMEVVFDVNFPGNVVHEYMPIGDFACPEDTRDLQQAEQVMRNYYFSKTALLEMSAPNSKWEFSSEQVTKVIEKDPPSVTDAVSSTRDRSLYKIQKVMFRVGGIVLVAWCCPEDCDDWICEPRPLFIGSRELIMQDVITATGGQQKQPMIGPDGLPVSQDQFETQYPYVIFPYLISENNTISLLKGRVYLDQDTQQAACSILSTYCTGLRRSSNFYASKDGDDPNTILQDTNIYWKPGTILKEKVKQFQIQPPPAECIQAVNAIVAANQNETSQVNFAVQNRKDSRKTATEVSAATQEQSKLTTVQVVLYSNSLRELYGLMFRVIQSRVNAGLIKVSQELAQMYQGSYTVKPAGDVDVIQRQEEVSHMMNAWPVVQSTPIGTQFFIDMMSKMFPENAAKYTKMMQDAMQQQQMQAQQQNDQNNIMMQQMVMKMGSGIVKLANSPDMFSDTGKIHALPIVKETANQIETMMGAKQQAQP